MRRINATIPLFQIQIQDGARFPEQARERRSTLLLENV